MQILTIDCDYLLPQYAAAYLLVDQREATFIDNNTNAAIPRLLSALSASGLRPDAVRYIIITHVHLDHAGGTAKLMQACPNATLIAHPRAARHMTDPSKLVASAKAVYGEAEFLKMYGELKPVEPARVKIMDDNSVLTFGGSEFEFWHTRGHANHHFCVFHRGENVVFTGDAFGLRYPVLQSPGRLFVLPSTSPTDFDPIEAVRSIDRIATSGAQIAYPTHFGGVSEIHDAAEQLKTHLAFSGQLLRSAKGRTAKALEADLRNYYSDFAKEFAWTSKQWSYLDLDLNLNAQGILFAAQRA